MFKICVLAIELILEIWHYLNRLMPGVQWYNTKRGGAPIKRTEVKRKYSCAARRQVKSQENDGTSVLLYPDFRAFKHWLSHAR